MSDSFIRFKTGMMFSSYEYFTHLGFYFSESLHNPCTFILVDERF